MKVIDKKFKIFGKISLLDILIILVVIGIVSFSAYILFTPNNSSETSEVTYKVLIEMKRSGFEKNIKVGDKVYNKTDNYEMGEILSFTTKEYEEAIYNEKENVYEMQKYPDHQTIELIIKGTFTNKDDRFYYNDNGLSANTPVTLMNENFCTHSTIDFIYPKEETTKEGK